MEIYQTRVRGIQSRKTLMAPSKTYVFLGIYPTVLGNLSIFHYSKNFLMNPFYYGVIRYAGEFYEGTHKPLITKSVFDNSGKVLNRERKTKKRKEFTTFPFCLMKCAEVARA